MENGTILDFWREEIQNRNRLLDLAGRNSKYRNRLLDLATPTTYHLSYHLPPPPPRPSRPFAIPYDDVMPYAVHHPCAASLLSDRIICLVTAVYTKGARSTTIASTYQSRTIVGRENLIRGVWRRNNYKLLFHIHLENHGA